MFTFLFSKPGRVPLAVSRLGDLQDSASSHDPFGGDSFSGRWLTSIIAVVVGVGVIFWGIPVEASPSYASYYFDNNDGITINDVSNASPYPSTISVSGISDSLLIDNVRVHLSGFSHDYPDDVDVFVVMPDGKVAVLLSDAGGGGAANNLSLSFDAKAGTVIPDSAQLTSGSYRPANYGTVEPLPPGATGPVLTTLKNGSYNGDWKLYVSDGLGGDTGSITSWTVEIVTTDTLDASYTNGTEVPARSSTWTATGFDVDFTLNYAPSMGTELMVHEMTGLNFMQGTYDNLPNGAPVTLSYAGTDYHFVAWYYGGDGNDLVLRWRDTGIAAWGTNLDDQLGTGGISGNVPVAVDQTGVLSGKTVVALSSGERQGLALCSDGSLASWGEGSLGQLGNSYILDSNVPVSVTGDNLLAGKTVIGISMGVFHSLALCSDGTVATWGSLDGTASRFLGNQPVLVSLTPITSTGRTVVSVYAGARYNLALTSDGTLYSWGMNDTGRLGRNLTFDVYYSVGAVTPYGVLAGKSVVAAAAGPVHCLALTADGILAAWGYGSAGQLGNGSTSLSNVPVAVDQTGVLSGKTVVAIAAGLDHSLALCADGTVYSWGGNTDGQLGNGTTAASSVPVAVNQSGVLSGKTVIAIAAGRSHSLAYCSDGSVAAWGENGSGELGIGSYIDSTVPALVSRSGLLAGSPFTRTISAGFAGSHALYPTRPEIAVEQPVGNSLTDGSATVDFGTLAFIGSSIDRTFTVRNTGAGELMGQFSIDGPNAADFSLPGGSGINVAPGGSTSFTVRFSAASAGAKSAALHLTNNDADESPFDINLTGTGSSVTALSANYSTGLEVPLQTAGYNATGRFVTFSLNYAPTPGTTLMVVDNTTPGFIEGTFNSLPNGAPVDLEFDGTTYHFVAWYYGGDGNDLVLLWRDTSLASWGSSLTPVSVTETGVLGGKTIVALAGGESHSLALCSDGTLAAWGSNNFGQLGNGSGNDSSVPVPVTQTGVLSGKVVIAIAAGAYHNLALCSDGTVAAWGVNSFGQLGDISTNQRNTPVLVTQYVNSALFNRKVVSIAAGYNHSLALCTDGTVAAWGWGSSGQLGYGSTSDLSVPYPVNQTGILSGKIVVALAGGFSHSLAQCSDGTVAAWGANTYGQLGDNSTTQRNSPVAVAQSGGLSGKFVTGIASGWSHSLAVCSDGTIAAWGDNSYGQLGDNSTTQQNSPVAVVRSGALSGKIAIDITAGRSDSLALCSDGTLASWGEPTGNSSPLISSFPVDITQSGVLSGNPVIRITRSRPTAYSSLVIMAAPPEIAVEQPTGIDLTDGSATIDFGTTVLTDSGIERTLTVRNTGLGELTGIDITIDGSDAGDFTVTASPATQIATGGSTTFTVRFLPTSLGGKSATLHLASSDGDENPFDISLTATAVPGAHIGIGDTVNLDLSWVTIQPGEALRVTGLPDGLVFNEGPPPTITGTALGLASVKGVFIQVLDGRKVVQTIPLELATEIYRHSGNYELLLEEAGQPVGKLRVTISNPSSKSPNPSYSATLEKVGELRRSAKGTFASAESPQSVSVVFPAFKTLDGIAFTFNVTEGSDLVSATTNPASAVTGRGFRLATASQVPTGNPALTLSLPPNVDGDRTTTPGGYGYATGTVTSKSQVPLRGLLGDAQSFSTSLYLSNTNQAVVWMTPYKNKQSYVGGIINIGDMGSSDRDASAETGGTGLQWKKELVVSTQEKSYPNGFGPLELNPVVNRWIAPRTADSLAQSLGLDFRAIRVTYIAPTADTLPDGISLRDTFALLPIAPTDAVPFSGKANSKLGNFAGTLTLPTPAAKSAVSGVLLQDANGANTLIGQGLVKIPIVGAVKGSFQTMGIVLDQTTTTLPGSHQFEIGDPVNIDLSAIPLAPGETLRILNLPPGLTLSGSSITGTVLGLGNPKGVQIQVLNGKTVTQTIPLDLAVEPYAFAANYEVLLEEAGLPVGILKVTVLSPTAKTLTPTYTATLERAGETRRSAKGVFTATASPQTVHVEFAAFKAFPSVIYDLVVTAGSDLVAGTTFPVSSVTARGFRLATSDRVPGGKPLITMAFPPAVDGDRVNTPGGIGYAKGSVNTKLQVPLAGLLGDGQKFTASLCLSQTNQAVIRVTPYKDKASYFGGIIDIGTLDLEGRGAATESATSGLKWERVAEVKATSYPLGFGPLDLSSSTSRWYAASNAEALGQSLGLSFRAIGVSYLAPTSDILPGRLSLRDNATLLSLLPDDSVKFSGKADGKGGTFGGTLALPAPATKSAMTGVFLQDESFNRLIGQGLIKVPITASVKGSFETIGVELEN